MTEDQIYLESTLPESLKEGMRCYMGNILHTYYNDEWWPTQELSSALRLARLLKRELPCQNCPKSPE